MWPCLLTDMFKATLMQTVTSTHLCEHYGVWHYEPRCLSSLWFVAFYVSVVTLLFRITYSRWIYNVPYYNRMPYAFIMYWQWSNWVVGTRNLGHILQLLSVCYHWRVGIAQWLQSQCESPGDAMQTLVIYCSSLLPEMQVVQAICHICVFLGKWQDYNCPWGLCTSPHYCTVKRNLFWHVWHGQKLVWI